MALSFGRSVGTGLALVLASFTLAQVPTEAPQAPSTDALDMSLSSQCRVPGSKLYTLAPLRAVRSALEEKRPVKVLALGPSVTAAFGLTSGTYPARLEEELEKVFSGIDVLVEQRSLPGEITADAFDRFTALLTEVEPDLLVWQVGTSDALAKADVEAFTDALNQILEWLKQTDTDVVLVELSYQAALASDDHYNSLIRAIQSSARKNDVPVVLRFEAMRFLSEQRTQAARNQFRLHELGYRCMAEHVARTISLSVIRTPSLQADAPK
jgi:lysophospholipase L1-like esterase